MSLLATLKVMLGVDSVDFQNKMRDSAASASVFENTFGQRATMVERHGMRLVNTADTVAGAMQRMNVDMAGSIAQIADVAGYAKLGIVLMALKVVWETLNATVKAVMADTMTAKTPIIEIAEAYAGQDLAMQGVAVRLMALQDLLIREGKERRGNTDRLYEYTAASKAAAETIAKENLAHNATINAVTLEAKLAAEKVAEEVRLHHESVAALDAAKEAQARFNAEHGKFIPASVQVQIALGKGQQQMKEFAEETRKTLGVMNAKDLQAQADLLLKQVVAIAQSGGSVTQTVDALGTKIEEVVKVAAELGVQLDPRFTDMAEAVKKGPGLAMEDLFGQFKGLPKEVLASRDASRIQLEKMGADLQGSISGGFGKGVKEGIDFGEQQLEEWRRNIEARGFVMPIKVDWTEYDRGVAARKSGQVPDTGGFTR